MAHEIKESFNYQFAFLGFFTTFLAAVYWDVLEKCCFGDLDLKTLKPSFIWDKYKIRLIVIFTLAFGLGEVAYRVATAHGVLERSCCQFNFLIVFTTCLLAFVSHFAKIQ